LNYTVYKCLYRGILNIDTKDRSMRQHETASIDCTPTRGVGSKKKNPSLTC